MSFSRVQTPEVRSKLFLFILVLGALQAQVSVPTHHNDNARTGANLSESFLTPANVNTSQFGKLYGVNLDGQVYAQPLYMSNIAIPNQGIRNIVFVATMNNSVYALDADLGGKQYWKSNFGPPVHPCDVEWHNNITHGSSIGITGTPVIDPSTKTIYFVSRNETNYNPQLCNWNSSAQQTGVNQGIFTQYLNALDITTGAPKFGSPVQIKATYSTADGTITFNPLTQNQRPGLTLANGNVYIAWASHDDLGDYHGWIISYKASNLAQANVYSDTTTSGAKGGIWHAGQGFTVDNNGNLLASTGNGSFGASPKGVMQTGNSFIKLSPTLKLLDYFTPYNSAVLNSSDQDLGASGLLGIPGTTLVAGGGKQGRMYLVGINNMGHFNASADNVQQEFQAIYGRGTQHIHGTPVYFNSSKGPLIYVWGENDYLRCFAFDISTQTLDTTPSAMSTMTAPMTNNNAAMPGGFLSISANGNNNGLIWASTPYKGDAAQATTQGVLHAFDALTLRELWSDKQNDSRDEVGYFAKYVPPVVANGKMFIPTFGNLNSEDGSGQLLAYGLLTLIPNGTYTISSVNSGLLLEVPGGSEVQGTVLDQAPASGSPSQSWQVTNLGGNVIRLTNTQTQMVVDDYQNSVKNSTPIIEWPFNSGENQKWQVTQVSPGVYTLANLRSGFLLDVYGDSRAAGAKLNQYQPNLQNNQRWTFKLH